MLYACDGRWWAVHHTEAKSLVKGEFWTADKKQAEVLGLNLVRAVKESGLSASQTQVHAGRNSGYQAIGLAVMWGASKIILLGFDHQRTGGKSHWHGDHEGDLPNLGYLNEWVNEMIVLAADARRAGITVLNATRQTAIKCFRQVSLAEALETAIPPMIVNGMHGLGDNLHQRALVRELMQNHEVWLDTPWPQVYRDLVGERLRLTSKGSRLRTQAKNAAAHAGKFWVAETPRTDDVLKIHYPPATVRAQGSVLAAMAYEAKLSVGDFRLPVPRAWHVKASEWLKRWKPTKPLMLYRPLCERVEWSGCRNRNPDAETYATLFESIAEKFFVVSVADLVPDVEWAVGRHVHANVECHKGELDFETLAALAMHAELVFCSPGFMAVLGQAVSTPVVNVVGGYEDGTSFASGAKYAPYLAIEPIKPCPCFSHTHDCDKLTDVPSALLSLEKFVEEVLPEALPARTLPISLDGLPTEYSNPDEQEALIELARSVKAVRALEIGCNSGRTSAALLKNVPTLQLMVGVDVLPGYVTDKAAQRNEVPREPGHLALKDPRFELVLRRRGSFELDARLGQYDFIFIDGDHGRAGVENDTRLARECIAPGGIIAWHDYNLTGVVDVREVLNEYRAAGRKIRRIAGTWIAYEQC